MARVYSVPLSRRHAENHQHTLSSLGVGGVENVLHLGVVTDSFRTGYRDPRCAMRSDRIQQPVDALLDPSMTNLDTARPNRRGW